MADAQNMSSVVGGVDIGGTNMQFGIVDPTNQIIARTRSKTLAAEGHERVIDRIVEGLGEACQQVGLTVSDLSAIGIAAAGAIDIPNGVVLIAPNLGWRDLPLRALLEERTNRPIALENDVNGAVWGEYHLGAGKGRGDVFGTWVGTGVGGGLVLNGQLYNGEFHTAGEFGFTIIDRDENGVGLTVEDLCSRTGISQSLRNGLKDHPGSMMHELIDAETGIAGSFDIAKAYQGGDTLTITVVDHAADLLGTAIANVVTMLSLDNVIVGGGITEALGEVFVSRIKTSFDKTVFPDVCKQCEIVTTTLEDRAGVLGAALLARKALQTDHAR